MRSHASILILSLACGCASKSVPSTPSDSNGVVTDGAAGSGGADADGADACQQQEDALLGLITQHQSCGTDSDCKRVHSECLFAGRFNCSGNFYVKNDLDETEFSHLDDALASCASGAGIKCMSCNIAPLAPACKSGECVPGAPE
jgi:hypothetical protein